MNDKIRVNVDEEKLKQESTVLFGLPDVGLVGPIAVKQMVDQLDMEEIGYIDSDGFPPITAVHGGRPKYPVRIYGKDSLVLVTSEIPIVPNLIVQFSKSMIGWLKKFSPNRVVIIGGLAHQNRTEVEEPEVHGVPATDSMEELMGEYDLHLVEDAFITGINGIFLRDLAENDLSGLYLMADSYRNYPDPGAAAAVLEMLNEMEGLSVSVEALEEKEEEIRVAARDLMRQTQKAMQKAGKEQEEEMPVMYG